MENPPVVTILHGDDEFEIARHVSEMERKLGDAALASLNITRLDGRSFNPEELLSIAGAMPFLAKRRLVILDNPLACLKSPAQRDKFKQDMERLPETAALVLVENERLPGEKERSSGRYKPHWLETWGQAHRDWVDIKLFMQPKGDALKSWIREQAKKQGGQITKEAGDRLADLVGDDSRQANQELIKLLTYVDYRRPVEVDDVDLLTADTAEGDIFKMVDALALRDGKQAMNLLQRLMEEKDLLGIFGMVIRQFRLLLLAREALDRGVPARKEDLARELGVAPFVADKVLPQARRFTLPALAGVYRRLLDMDVAIKTGQVPIDLALETFVAAFTSQPGSRSPAR